MALCLLTTLVLHQGSSASARPLCALRIGEFLDVCLLLPELWCPGCSGAGNVRQENTHLSRLSVLSKLNIPEKFLPEPGGTVQSCRTALENQVLRTDRARNQGGDWNAGGQRMVVP